LWFVGVLRDLGCDGDPIKKNEEDPWFSSGTQVRALLLLLQLLCYVLCVMLVDITAAAAAATE
jgi:hypothetical protein